MCKTISLRKSILNFKMFDFFLISKNDIQSFSFLALMGVPIGVANDGESEEEI